MMRKRFSTDSTLFTKRKISKVAWFTKGLLLFPTMSPSKNPTSKENP